MSRVRCAAANQQCRAALGRVGALIRRAALVCTQTVFLILRRVCALPTCSVGGKCQHRPSACTDPRCARMAVLEHSSLLDGCNGPTARNLQEALLPPFAADAALHLSPRSRLATQPPSWGGMRGSVSVQPRRRALNALRRSGAARDASERAQGPTSRRTRRLKSDGLHAHGGSTQHA